MRTYFISQDLWDIVDKGFSTPENPTVEMIRQEKKDKQKDANALFAKGGVSRKCEGTFCKTTDYEERIGKFKNERF